MFKNYLKFLFISVILFSIISCNNQPARELKPFEYELTVNVPADSFDIAFTGWLNKYFGKRNCSYALAEKTTGYFDVNAKMEILYEAQLNNVAGNLPFSFNLKAKQEGTKLKLTYSAYKITNNEQSQDVTLQYSEQWFNTFFEKMNADLLEQIGKK